MAHIISKIMEPTITISVADYNLLVRKAKQESYDLKKLVDYIFDCAYKDLAREAIINALKGNEENKLEHLIEALQL